MSWYRQGLQVAIGLVSNCLWTYTYATAFDIGLNIFSEAQLIVFPADEVLGFIDTEMSCQRVVVVSNDDLCLNGFRYKR